MEPSESKSWKDLNPPPPNVNYDIKQNLIKKKSGLVVLHEEIFVSFTPFIPVETIELKLVISNGS